MTAKQQREIVIEFEKVQLIRRRAKTVLVECRGCGVESDFVAAAAAAELFDITGDDFLAFVNANGVHHDRDANICISSLLAVMQARHNGGGVHLIGQNRER